MRVMIMRGALCGWREWDPGGGGHSRGALVAEGAAASRRGRHRQVIRNLALSEGRSVTVPRVRGRPVRRDGMRPGTR
jgi:hypothetical protein